MSYTEIDNAAKGAQADTFTDYSVDAQETDAATGDKVTEYINPDAAQQLGYYKTIPELKMAIDTKATWTIGKGFLSESATELMLGTIKGFGKDTFNSILENLIREYHIYGDAFAEIIREGEKLVNLKPLNPAKIKIIADSKGMIIRYEQQTGKGKAIKIAVENMFHLCRARIADEIHGTSIIKAVEEVILMRNEAMADYKKLLHRNIYPSRVHHLDTDVASKIASYKAKVAEAKAEGEDLFVPKGSVEMEVISVPPNSTLDPKAWIQLLNPYFFQAVGVPQIIIGGSQELTQTAAQIAYLAFEQTISEEQLFVEEQVLSQLNIEINLEFPASLQNNLLSDDNKDGTQEQQLNQSSNMQPPMARGAM